MMLRSPRMPNSYTIDRVRRLVRSRAWGLLSNDDLREHYAKIAADPSFQPSFRQLADLRQVTALTVDARTIAENAGIPVFDPKVRRAFIASSDVAFGLARMFATYAEERAAQNIQVFREMDAAEAWLESGRVDDG
jgi:hypothetical protein